MEHDTIMASSCFEHETRLVLCDVDGDILSNGQGVDENGIKEDGSQGEGDDKDEEGEQAEGFESLAPDQDLDGQEDFVEEQDQPQVSRGVVCDDDNPQRVL